MGWPCETSRSGHLIGWCTHVTHLHVCNPYIFIASPIMPLLRPMQTVPTCGQPEQRDIDCLHSALYVELFKAAACSHTCSQLPYILQSGSELGVRMAALYLYMWQYGTSVPGPYIYLFGILIAIDRAAKYFTYMAVAFMHCISYIYMSHVYIIPQTYNYYIYKYNSTHIYILYIHYNYARALTMQYYIIACCMQRYRCACVCNIYILYIIIIICINYILLIVTIHILKPCSSLPCLSLALPCYVYTISINNYY